MTSPGSFLYILFLKFFPLDNIVLSKESSPVLSELERALAHYTYITLSFKSMFPPLLVQCTLYIGHVMADFTLEFELLDMSLGMREDSALVFVTEVCLS